MGKLYINLENLLRQHNIESERIEYKTGWNPDPILRTICAFANDFENLGGGYIVIGQDCDSSGQPVFPPKGIPVDSLDRIQQELLRYCNLISPPYFPVLSLEQFEDRHLLILWAPGGQNRPYKVPKVITSKTKNYGYYIRRYSSTVLAQAEIEQELIGLTAKVPFDDRPHQEADINCLSSELMVKFLESVGSGLSTDASSTSTSVLGRQMNIISGPAEHEMPKNIGLLFFNETPEHFFPALQIDVVYFPDGPGGDQFEERVFKGPLDRIIQDALSYIKRNYLKQTVVKHSDRAEVSRFWNFPFPAIEEALVNAVYHRSYEIREPIEVRITDEELVVLSYPGPDRSIPMKILQRGNAVSRRYRNRRIGEFLKELNLAEGRATGISKILRVMKANKSPNPEFETDEERTYFLIRLLSPTPQVALQVSPQVKKLLSVIHGESTREELQASLGLSDRKNFKNRYLAPAILAGLIELTNPEKPRSKGQKYRLTEVGVQLLDSTPQVDPPVQVQRLIAVMSGEIPQKEIQERLQLSDRQYFRRNYLLPALRDKLIEMTLPDIPQSTRQRYRLTKLGWSAKERILLLEKKGL